MENKYGFLEGQQDAEVIKSIIPKMAWEKPCPGKGDILEGFYMSDKHLWFLFYVRGHYFTRIMLQKYLRPYLLDFFIQKDLQLRYVKSWLIDPNDEIGRLIISLMPESKNY